MYITRIYSSNSTYSNYAVGVIGNHYAENYKNNVISSNNNYYNDINIIKMPKSITFMGETLHIVDGGNHATNMQHFAKAINKDIDIKMHDVEINPINNGIKQLKSLEEQLKCLNNKNSISGEYIAIPALASVPILNLQDQYNKIMDEDKRFTPENIKNNKQNILTFLKKIYDNPSLYKKYIDYMDPQKQGIEYTYGVIREVNKLKSNGAKVYIPSGHSYNETIKWMAQQQGLKPDYYHYVATGIDNDNNIHKILEDIKYNNWYDFNLLSLSDANIIAIKPMKEHDELFSSYDSCITDEMRGFYNFSPIRKNDKLIGYSYTDKTTNEYPYDEFPANEVLKLRSQNIQYLADLYPEIKEYI